VCVKVNRPRIDLEPAINQLAGNLPCYWLSYWLEKEVLFWALAFDGVPIDGGEIRLSDDVALRESLTIVTVANRLQTRWRVDPTLDVNLDHRLARADSFDEITLTAPLAALIPPALRTTSETPRRLILSPAPELAGIPWPIIPVDPEVQPTRRLIEEFELHFAPSLASLADVPPREQLQPAAQIPFLFSCDFYPDDPSPIAARGARVRFGPSSRIATESEVQPATSEGLLRTLAEIRPGAYGLGYFRTHFQWQEFAPTESGFVLEDDLLPSGWLFVADAGRPLAGLPSRLILSCCSTTGLRGRFGGESLGLVAASMWCGAREIIATSIDVRQTAFTNALDEMLIKMALTSACHIGGLRALQLRLLNEWRRYSALGIADDDGGDWSPSPAIWAYYQACGLRRTDAA